MSANVTNALFEIGSDAVQSHVQDPSTNGYTAPSSQSPNDGAYASTSVGSAVHEAAVCTNGKVASEVKVYSGSSHIQREAKISCGKHEFYMEYIFKVVAAGIEETIQFRFSALRAVHDTLIQRSDLAFPSQHVFRDMVKTKNADLRSKEFEQYLQALFNKCDVAGSVITNPVLHETLKCSKVLVQALSAVAAVRQQAEAGRREEAIRQQRQQQAEADARRRAEAARLEAIRQQQVADRKLAQNANKIASGQVTALVFPRPLTFELRSGMFLLRSTGRLTIKGPGGFDWFSMLRTSSIFSKRDTEVIATCANEPVLALHRQFRWMHYEYRLERVASNMSRVPMCVVTRELQLFAPATYTIQTSDQTFGGAITCEGQWFEDFVLRQGGKPACRIRRRGWSVPKCYDVVIQPQCDVLLFLGIACAIDHIHHEIEERRR